MRPLELSLAGFTSFRDEQHLDFSELDLFAITGATGAGKSSLLDAITFALYGTTARTSQVAELVSQGATTLKVQLRFAIAGEEYRVTRRWRYRPSTPESKVLLERSRHDSTWETLETKERSTNKLLEQILGMDFDTFTRVILLPQGQFDEFLKGSPGKRREILRQLAGFEIFERMRKEASDLAKLLKQELDGIERQLADLEAPNEVEIAWQRSQLEVIEVGLPKLNAAVLEAQKRLEAEEQLFAQIQRQLKLQQELTALKGKSKDIEALTQQLARSQAANELQADWALVQEARSQAEKAEQNVESAKSHFQKVAKDEHTQLEQFEQAKARQTVKLPELRAREAALASAKVYEEQRSHLAQEVAIVQKSLQQQGISLERANQELKTAQETLKTNSNRLTQTTRSLEQYSPGGDRLAQLEAVAPLLVEWKFFSQQVKTYEKKQEKAAQALKTAQKSDRATLEQLEDAEVALETTRAKLHKAELENTEAEKLNLAAAVRKTLEPGDICPVCGGNHPESGRLPPLPSLKVIDLQPLRSQFTQAEQLYTAAQTEKTKVEALLESAQQKFAESEQELALSQEQLETLKTTINTELESEEWDAIALERERQTLKDSETKYQAALIEHQKAIAEQEQAQQAVEFAQTKQQTIQEQYQNAIAELERQQQHLDSITAKVKELTGGENYETLARSLEQEKQSLEKLVQTAENNYQVARSLAIQAEEREKNAISIATEATTKREQLNQSWETKLKATNFTETSFLTACADNQTQAKWQTTISEYREATVEVETRLNDLNEIIGDRLTDERAIAQCRALQKTAEQKVQQANDERVKLATWIQRAEEKLIQAAQLLTQQETLTQSQETYHALAQNLKSNEFQAYILEHLEAELVARATVMLRELTDSRYALRIQEGEYWVEDNWNGGELRRVRTLSGGETFATSLSMALALSEKLSMGAELGSLFLDEGFGTLDANTLESVIQILESLRQRSRTIGVITHVRALGERLPTQIKVYKSPAGSRLEIERL